MVFILQGLLIFKKLAGNKIICVWGNAQISDNECSQLTRIIQSYWHNHFHVKSHTCQTQKNRSFVIFSWSSSIEELPQGKEMLFSVLFSSFDPYSSRSWTFSEWLDFLPHSLPSPLCYLESIEWDTTKFTFRGGANWVFIWIWCPTMFAALILQSPI